MCRRTRKERSKHEFQNNNKSTLTSLHWIFLLSPHRALGSTPSWAKDLAQALLRVQDVNVLVVDWIYSASFAYNVVVQSYKEVAVEISVLISQLQVGGSSGITLHQPSFTFQNKVQVCFGASYLFLTPWKYGFISFFETDIGLSLILTCFGRTSEKSIQNQRHNEHN